MTIVPGPLPICRPSKIEQDCVVLPYPLVNCLGRTVELRRKHRSSSGRNPARSAMLLHLPFTLMTFGLVSSALGKVSVSTPFSNTASALSPSTGTFSASVRDRVP